MADDITQDDEYEYEYIELEEGQELPEGVEYEFVEVEDGQSVTAQPSQKPIIDELEEVDLSVFAAGDRNIDDLLDEILEDKPFVESVSLETEDDEQECTIQDINDLEIVKPLSSAELLSMSKAQEPQFDTPFSFNEGRVEPSFSDNFEEEVIAEVPFVQAMDEEEEILDEVPFSLERPLEEEVAEEVILSFDEEEILDEVPLVHAIGEEEEVLDEVPFSLERPLEEEVAEEVVLSFDEEEILDEVPLVQAIDEEEEVLDEVPLTQEIEEDILDETVLSFGADISPLEKEVVTSNVEFVEEVIPEVVSTAIITPVSSIVMDAPKEVIPTFVREDKIEAGKLYDIVEIDEDLKRYAKTFDASKTFDNYQSKDDRGVISISAQQAKLVVFNRQIISLGEDVREVNLPLDKDVTRYVRVIKGGEEKLSLFNEEILRFMVPTEEFVKIKSHFIYGNLEKNTGLIVDDVVNISLESFKGNMLQFAKPVNGILIAGSLLYFADLEYLIVE